MRGKRDDDDDRDERDEAPKRGGFGNHEKIVVLGVAALLLTVVGVVVWRLALRGETNDEVIAKYRQRFADLRWKVKRMGAQLPPGGSVTTDNLPANLNPKPVFDVPDKTFNTAIIMARQCADPDREPPTPTEFNIRFHEDEFLTHLTWTGEQNPMVESARRAPAKDLEQRFERTLAMPYLVIVRPVQYTPPRVVDDKTFTGGEVDLEVFLIDLPGEKVLGAFRRALRPDPQVMVTFRKGESENAEAWVYSNLWSKARNEVTATLSKGTGGKFAIER